MNAKVDIARRSLIISTAGATTPVFAICISGCQSRSESDRQLQFSSLSAAEEELARLTQAKGLDSRAAWNWAQTMAHCAQSIEYSMKGFPEPKSELFQRTVGSAAFGVFSWRGRMTHDLAEPIPGAPALEVKTESTHALERLRASIFNFRRWSEPLKPHFAYGVLDKKEYELAHAMHLANHFSAFSAKT